MAICRWALAALAAAAVSAAPVAVVLDGRTALHTFHGHGALSAGASSRLLWDYPEPQRSEVLDYLFKPNFGMALQILKVEIGGDAQSTDGTEPSHRHTRDDLSCTRGYELFLIQEGLKRNPDLKTYGLAWGTPEWVNNGSYYGPDQIAYQVDWMKCIRQESSSSLTYMGLWNEKPQPDAGYVLQLRAAMDAAGFSETKIIVMDGGYDASEVATAQANASYRAAVFGAGLHYPCDNPQPDVRELGWQFWSSEDYSRDPAWADGATYWGKALSQNYLLSNQTATISWSLIWSAYTNLVCNGAGLMRAHQPWTGNYEASAPIWLTAHWTQFASPGWRFLHVPGGGSGWLDVAGSALHGGSYVTLVPADSLSGMTVIIETLDNDSCLKRNLSSFDVTFTTRGGLPGPGTTLFVWRTTQSAYFVQMASITIAADSTFRVSVSPDSMMTVSTVATANHGAFPDTPIPAAAQWPLPYSDNFDAYPFDAMARYFSDQGGSWAARNGSLVQVSGGNPAGNGWAPNPDPLTQIGDETWVDYVVSATVAFSPPAAAQAAPSAVAAPHSRRLAERLRERERQWGSSRGLPVRERVANEEAVLLEPCDATDAAQRWAFDSPAPGYLSNLHLCVDVAGCNPAAIDLYDCVVDPGGSSCGAPPGQYPNLRWNLDAATGALTSAMDNAALTLHPTNRTLFLAPFSGDAATQVWTYQKATQQLSVGGLCLSAPPVKTYAMVCGRIASYDGFNAASTPGYCLELYASGNWSLASNSVPIVQGQAPQPFSPQTPHRMAVSMAGTVIEAFLDGRLIASVVDAAYSVGNAALGSGWHACAFDDFAVTTM